MNSSLSLSGNGGPEREVSAQSRCTWGVGQMALGSGIPGDATQGHQPHAGRVLPYVSIQGHFHLVYGCR